MQDTLEIPRKLRSLRLILGDQLDAQSALFDGFDPAQDALLMTEALEEARYVAQHKKRLVLFFAAMRHFAEAQRAEGRAIIYNRLDHPNAPESLAEALIRAAEAHRPERITVVRPGDWRVLTALEQACERLALPLEVLEDRHFLTQPQDFAALREGRKRFILEDFYRAQRKRTGWLMQGTRLRAGAGTSTRTTANPLAATAPAFCLSASVFRPTC